MNKVELPPVDEQLKNMKPKKDEEIDFSDIPEIQDWSRAIRGSRHHPARKSVTLPIDADIVAWFSRFYPECQSAINNVLKDYIKTQSDRT